MTHQELIERYDRFGLLEWDKRLYVEYLTIMNYMSDEDFNNRFHIKDISDSEFMSILDFYYEHKCFLMLFKLLRDHRKERFVHPDIEDIEDIKNMEIRQDFEERQRRFFM